MQFLKKANTIIVFPQFIIIKELIVIQLELSELKTNVKYLFPNLAEILPLWHMLNTCTLYGYKARTLASLFPSLCVTIHAHTPTRGQTVDSVASPFHIRRAHATRAEAELHWATKYLHTLDFVLLFLLIMCAQLYVYFVLHFMLASVNM